MEMRQLRYFAKVAELGNITRAAEACFVSQPSLSQQLAKLEQELGQPLFERLGRGVRLTATGRVFKQYCDQILSLTEDARTRMADDPTPDTSSWLRSRRSRPTYATGAVGVPEGGAQGTH